MMADEVEGYLAAAADGWDWVAEPGPAGVVWQLAWALHGLPEPLPRRLYRQVLGAVEARHGVAAVIRGLLVASTIPAAHGSGVDPAEFRDLAARFERGRSS